MARKRDASLTQVSIKRIVSEECVKVRLSPRKCPKPSLTHAGWLIVLVEANCDNSLVIGSYRWECRLRQSLSVFVLILG
jgi:hypothetical protein